jgi:hypothetical protein
VQDFHKLCNIYCVCEHGRTYTHSDVEKGTNAVIPVLHRQNSFQEVEFAQPSGASGIHSVDFAL